MPSRPLLNDREHKRQHRQIRRTWLPASPPITALPSGAVTSAASAMGIMPAIMAALVIRMGRMRSLTPWIPDSKEEAPLRRCCSANVTSRMAFAVPTPTAMMRAHIGFDIERRMRDQKHQDHAAHRRGRRCENDESKAQRLVVRGQQQKDDQHRERQADAEVGERVVHGRDLPADLHRGAASAECPRCRMAASMLFETRPRSCPAMFAERVNIRKPLRRSYSPMTVPSSTLARSPISGCCDWPGITGMFCTSCSEVMLGCGYCTCT